MNRTQARQFVTDTFTHAFDKARFRNFVLNVVNHLDESKAQQWNPTYVKDAFKDHVHRYERLGTYTSPGKETLDVLVVYLTTESKLERARTSIRNFVADHLKKRDEKDAALVAFVSPSENTWRFSYVKMEYATVAKESGRVGVETKLTPARRFSYIVGEGESCHTAQTRFLALLGDTGTDPLLASIEEAFSVEAVTKEFFTKYADLFLQINAALEDLAAKDRAIRDEFASKSVNTVDFAKKLMGQIVFLYFLQKKGWLGVAKGKDWGSGPRDLLRRLANGEYSKYHNFFNDILEPLFYDTLATDRGHEAWCEQFKCRIPFLNGGLFEPLGDYNWSKIDIHLSNRLFTNTDHVDEGVTGTGVLDVFDRYNFTVNEAEPLEKEVAIDPEMLGKVFENLIEENRRRGLGSFYTPREIVHFMCQESLINYLDSSLIRDGANVPLADLETFVHLGEQISHYEAVDTKYPIRMPKSIELNARLIDDKLSEITVCDPAVGSGAFPVGMMTEIVRARCALTPYFNDVHERTAYHFKRHAIQNSLYGVDIDPGAVAIAELRLWLSLVVDEEDVKQIKPLPNLAYKIITGNSLQRIEKTLFNEKLFKRLEELKPKYFDESNRKRKDALKQEIDALIHELTDGKEAFDFEIYFSEVFHKSKGFDVVIMNPPYGASLSEGEKNHLKSRFEHISERIRNTYLYFTGLAYDTARSDGVACLIMPNEFLFQIYMTKARKFFLSNAKFLFAINAGEDVFEAIVPTCIVAFQKQSVASYDIPVADLRGSSLYNLPRQLDVHSFPRSSNEMVLGTPNAMFSFDLERTRLIKKLSTGFPSFGDLCEDVANGICTSCDEIYIVPETVATIEQLEGEYLKKCLRGGQFNRYFCPSDTHEYVLYVTDGLGPKHGKNTYAYLLKNKEFLIEKCVEKKSGARAWQILFRGRYPELFVKPKILIRQTSDRIIAAIDDKVGYYCINSVNVALPKPQFVSQTEYLVGLLNSAVLNFFYREISQEKGRVLAEVKPQRIRALPIPTPQPKEEASITDLTRRIVAAKQLNAQADTTVLELEVDRLVYGLYSLTPTEVALVENSRPHIPSKRAAKRS
jgi:type I restriction-modification system DNA methylase subunit